MKLLIALCLIGLSSPAWCGWNYRLDPTTAGLSSIRVDGRAVPALSGIPAGIRVNEVVSRDGMAVPLPTGDRFSSRASTTVSGKALLVTVEITDTGGGDSAAQVFYQVPVDMAGWRWHNNLGDAKAASATGLTQSIYPLSVLTNPGTNAGLAVAIAPETPCVFSAGCSAEKGLYVEARLGFSSATNPPSRARIEFAIYPVDGAWGMRAALKEYYRIFPKAYERRAMKEGLWLFRGDAVGLPNPTEFGYHEIAQLGKGENESKQANGFSADGVYDREMKWGIELYPYVIPGQREVGHLKELKGEGTAIPKLADEADGEKAFDTIHYSTAEAMAVLDGATQKNIGPSETLSEFKDLIKSSSLVGSDGDIVTMPRQVPWAGRALTFPLNPNPFVPKVGSSLSIGALVLEDCRRSLSLPYDGIYVDSLWRWGNFMDYRKDHFAVTRTGLTYGADGRPVLSNALEHLTFLDELGKLLHQKKRILFGNGVRPGRFWHAQVLDVAGAEMGAAPIETFAFNRAASSKKPYLGLNHLMGKDEAKDRQFLAKCVLFGVYGSGDRDYYTTEQYWRIKPIYDTYLPLQKVMNRLGWEPVTAAKPLTSGVLAERFGDGRIIYFTLYDTSESKTEAALELDLVRLGLSGKKLTATDGVTGKKLETTKGADGKLKIPHVPINHGIGVVKIKE